MGKPSEGERKRECEGQHDGGRGCKDQFSVVVVVVLVVVVVGRARE